jgi:mRNA interferase MazF
VTVKRGEVWFADLNPTRGSEQAGFRPVVVFQADLLNELSNTVLAIPLTTNLRRAALPSCLLVQQGDGGLPSDSVALCHQTRVLDKARLQRRLGALAPQTVALIENRVLFTMGII